MKLRFTTLLLFLSLMAASRLPAKDALIHPRYEHAAKRGKWWKASLGVLAATSAIDAHSSWGRPEANPILRGNDGRFGWQAVFIKTAVFGGVASAQYLLLRKQPETERFATATNLVFSGVLAGAAVSNYQRFSTTSPNPPRKY